MKNRISSILVALDSTGAMQGLKAAAELALKTGAELNALYVEDVNWFEACRMSFSHQVSSYTGRLVPFDEAQLTKESKALSARLRKKFTNAVQSTNVKYSYRNIRGIVNSELLIAANESDLVVIRRNARNFTSGNCLGSTAMYLAMECVAPVLIWNDQPIWPDQFTGFCLESENCLSVLDWTFTLADLLGRTPKLAWNESLDLTGILESLEISDWNLVERIRRSSVPVPELFRTIEKDFSRSLLIFERKSFINSLSNSLDQFTNSFLVI